MKQKTTNNCLGIPVRYDPAQIVLVDSRGIWKWKAIVVGPGFFQFAPREQQAMLLHEVGHCKMNHVAKLVMFLAKPQRLWRFIACAVQASRHGWKQSQFHEALAYKMPDLAAFRMMQELEADRFASGCGYGADLIAAFGRIRSEGGPFHPHPAQRVARLLGVG